jgi:glycine cleavage system pyridoxal-binding protein P
MRKLLKVFGWKKVLGQIPWRMRRSVWRLNMLKAALSALALTAVDAPSSTASAVNFAATGSTGVPAGFGMNIGSAT